jgi:hypothetical protein
MREMRIEYSILDRKPKGKGSLRRSGRRWKDNIRMDFREVGWEGVYLMHLAQVRDQWWLS